MTTQNDTQNLSPVLIEDIDPAAVDSLDYESMEGPELGHSDDEGEVNSVRVKVNALVQQEKGNSVYKKDDSRGHFQAATQTMSQVQQQQNITQEGQQNKENSNVVLHQSDGVGEGIHIETLLKNKD